jgi:hypothetical protein
MYRPVDLQRTGFDLPLCIPVRLRQLSSSLLAQLRLRGAFEVRQKTAR